MFISVLFVYCCSLIIYSLVRQSLSKKDLSAASKLLAAVNLDNAEKSAYLRIYSIEDIRILVKHFLYKSTLGIVYNDVMLCISILSCFEFIYQTYLNPNRPEDLKELHILDYIEKGLAVLFTFDWLLNLFIADLKLIFMTRYLLFYTFFHSYILFYFKTHHLVSTLWWMC